MKEFLQDLYEAARLVFFDAAPFLLFSALLVLIGNGTIPS